MAFDLSVLGCSGSHTGSGRVCSGYLLQTDDARVLMDAGNGSTANLQRSTRFDELDAVIVTHRHVDHCADLVGMFYALKYGEQGGPVDLYAAAEVADLLTFLLGRDSSAEFADVFRVIEVAPGTSLSIGDIDVEFFAAEHPVPTVSVRATSQGATLAYSSDTAGNDDLIRCAQDADLFLCEATWQGDPTNWPSGIHLTAGEAGRYATKAGVGTLMLTHIAGGLDREVSRDQAQAAFSGDVTLADDNQLWTLA